MNVASVALEFHVAGNLLHVYQTGLALELKFGFFWNRELQIGLQIQRLRCRVQDIRCHVNAVARLFNIETDLVGRLRSDDIDFFILPRLYLNAAVRHVVDHHYGASGDVELPFDALCGTEGRSNTSKKESSAEDGQKASLHPTTRMGPIPPNQLKAHVSLCSFRAQSSRTVIRLFVRRLPTDIRASAHPAAVL